MPGFERAEVTAELKVQSSGENQAQDPVEAAKSAAAETGLAHEAGPEVMILAGGQEEVLESAMSIVAAALDAGASGVDLKVEAQGDASRFGTQE